MLWIKLSEMNTMEKNIGLLLCNGGDKVVAQYALSGYD